MLLLFIKKISSFLRSEGKKEAALPFGQPDRLSLHGLPSQGEGLLVSKESKTASILNNFGGTPDIRVHLIKKAFFDIIYKNLHRENMFII
jgi:hypothetical protein